ncbi:iron-containing alcohol dehydrogenase [Alphaproteobacteria bacterium]|nr:iron-containing alcohol dehydrogenase [Alphaproteobacteria bacterium]
MNWNYPTTVWFGPDRSKQVQQACDTLGIKNPLIVTDPGLLQTPIIEEINSNLSSKTNVYSDVQGNPTGSNVTNGVKVFLEGNHDGVIAIGGGSGMDAGKGIAFLAHQKRPLWDFEDIGDWWTRADSKVIKPIIAIPTTAGTGSEVGRAGVFLNEENHKKKIIFHPKMLPQIAILDPSLTINLPKGITAGTGMDALAHCLEAYSSPFYHPMAEGTALEGLRLVKENIQEVFHNGKNIEARAHMLVASMMGAAAFQKGLGAIHSITHPVNSLYHTHHGTTNGTVMPFVLNYNRSVIEDKFVRLANFLDIKGGFDGIVQWVIDLKKEMEIPETLKDMGVQPGDEVKLAPLAQEDPSTGGNPLEMTEEKFQELILNCISGKY